MLPTRFNAWTFAIAAIVLPVTDVFAQDYPSRPIRIVIGTPGGGNDFVARLLAPGLSAGLGQPVIVDNKANTMISSEVTSKASADGYTLHVNGATLWVYTLLQKAPYDAVKDFSPVTQVTREASVVVVHPSVQATSIKELVALAKARPGTLTYGSTGVGGPQHIGTELFKSMTGVDLLHVPYKGTAPGLAALIGGQVQVMFTDGGTAAPHVKSGKLRALAVTSAEPSVLYPGLPTVAASGVPGYELVGISGIFVPAKTPAAVVNRLNQEIVRVLNVPDVKERFLVSGAEIVGSSPQQFAAVIAADIARKSKVIKDAGIKVD